jgi:hypothetical protein
MDPEKIQTIMELKKLKTVQNAQCSLVLQTAIDFLSKII